MGNAAQRNWDEGWAALEQTIRVQDVWLLTDRIKLHYLLPYLSSEARALEVGCGSAKLSALLSERAVRTTGIDLSPQALRVARNNFAALRTSGDFAIGDALYLPLPDNHFNLVFSTGLLEHFRNPLPLVQEMVRVLQPGGLFFSDIAPLKFSLLRLGFYLRGYQKRAFDEYAYSAHDIQRWLLECGLQEVRVFASGVVPPLGLIRRSATLRNLSFRFERIWRFVDGTWLANQLGFFYLAIAKKPEAPL